MMSSNVVALKIITPAQPEQADMASRRGHGESRAAMDRGPGAGFSVS
jgi:hypothetical protein